MRIRIESKTMKDNLNKAIHELEEKGLLYDHQILDSPEYTSNSDYTETTNYVIADVDCIADKEFGNILKRNDCSYEQIVTVKNKD